MQTNLKTQQNFQKQTNDIMNIKKTIPMKLVVVLINFQLLAKLCPRLFRKQFSCVNVLYNSPNIDWRRGRDSNSWCNFSHTAFPGLHLKPLGHLCKWKTIKVYHTNTKKSTIFNICPTILY